ncbi:MAG: ABC transporter ATP-binding protein, partial [Candidatus Cloacimonetes bacterium]|nr:ABC transporter ATP-binding protein [Candidatus Cloacimonadota bacterium]
MPDQKQNLKYYINLLYPFIKKDIGLLGFGLFAMLCTSVLQLVYPLILANIVDKSIPSGNLSQMYLYGGMFIAAVILSGILTYLQTVLLSKLGVKVITKFKAQVFRHLLTLPIQWFNKQAVGELIARVESDAERVKALFSNLSIRIIGNLLFFLGVFLVMFFKEWHIAIYIL